MPTLSSAKHEAFARAIVEGKSGREAYQSAGYKATDAAADVAASRLLRNAKVLARVEELKAAAAKKTTVTVARVLDELAKIAFANMGDYMQVGADGDPHLDFSKLTPDQAAALQEITVEDFIDGRGKGARNVRKVRFKLCDKRAALVDLGKHLGIFRDKFEMTGKNGGPIEIIRRTLKDLENEPMELPGPESGDGLPEVVREPPAPPAAPPGGAPLDPIEDDGLDWLN